MGHCACVRLYLCKQCLGLGLGLGCYMVWFGDLALYFAKVLQLIVDENVGRSRSSKWGVFLVTCMYFLQSKLILLKPQRIVTVLCNSSKVY